LRLLSQYNIKNYYYIIFALLSNDTLLQEPDHKRAVSTRAPVVIDFKDATGTTIYAVVLNSTIE
jgi:hypothetical protein